ncbi:MAG: DUF4013 domain-containing protein, partial [Chloroflexi bacterium]|nr:DUF4013 domain-containing protein [Chloroflexota bacterium]
IQYARTGEFGSLFRFGEIMAIVRNNIGDILLTIVAYLAASFVLQFLIGISIITICGPLVIGLAGTLWVLLAQAHLYGQIAAKTEGKALS